MVGGIPNPLKNDGVSSSVGMTIPFPTEWKVIIHSMVPVTTNQIKMVMFHFAKCKRFAEAGIIGWVDFWNIFTSLNFLDFSVDVLQPTLKSTSLHCGGTHLVQGHGKQTWHVFDLWHTVNYHAKEDGLIVNSYWNRIFGGYPLVN